jgi:plastocyanin
MFKATPFAVRQSLPENAVEKLASDSKTRGVGGITNEAADHETFDGARSTVLIPPRAERQAEMPAPDRPDALVRASDARCALGCDVEAGRSWMRSPHRWLALLAGAAIVAAPVSALAAKGHKPQAPKTYTVTLADMKFGPTPPTIHVGDTIEWVNNDIFLHSATATDKAFDVELKPKAHLWTTFHKAGTYPFTCRYHPGMKGTLVVKK